MLSIVVKITPEDIAEGKQTDCADCPLARAVTRALPGHTGIFAVTIDHVVYAPPTLANKGPVKTWWSVCVLSPEAKAWVAAFDFGRAVEPVELPLNFYLPPLP